jgi:hypothetical protein
MSGQGNGMEEGRRTSVRRRGEGECEGEEEVEEGAVATRLPSAMLPMSPDDACWVNGG